MLETHSTNLAESIRILMRDSDERRQRIVASADVAKAAPKRRLRSRRVRERRTFYAMFAFGLLLGGLELFIVLHAL